MKHWIVAFVLMGLLFAGLSLYPGPAKVNHPYFDGAPFDRSEILAHGGGQGAAPQNTLLALETALAMGADVLEVDVQMTGDGILILRHDDTLDRTTDMTGPISEKTWTEISQADAGAKTNIEGVSFAGRGIGVPRLDNALEAFPEARWIIEIKNDTELAPRALCEIISTTGTQERVLVGSFHDAAMKSFRKACPAVATSYSTSEVRNFVLASRVGLSRFVWSPGVAIQVPVEASGLDLTHPRFIHAAKARGLRIQYWTINERDDMRTLLAEGANGLITDYVDRGVEVLSLR